MSEFQQDLQDEELDFLLMDKEGATPEKHEEHQDPESIERDTAPPGELKPTLHGDLTQVNLPDIFQSLVMSQMEGTLQVNSKWKVTYVHHEAGKLRILLPEEDWLKRIGYRLLSSGLVDGRDLKAALRRCHKEQVDLGQILTESYGTDPEQFKAIRRALEEDAIFELFTQNRGNFAFYGDAYPDPDLERRFATSPTFEASNILLEVARRSDEWTVILREIEDINEIMRPTEDAYREGVEVDEIEENLLSHLDGTRSLSDIAGGMLYCLFDVMKSAQTLIRRNLIEKVPTEDLFALTEADIHAEQEKRAAYYLNLVSTFRKPLPLHQLCQLAELQIRVNRPRDAGKTYGDCADITDDEDQRLHYLYEAKRLDPRNPETLTRLLDALALYLSQHQDSVDPGEEDGPADEDDIHPELALDEDPVAAEPQAPSKGRKKRTPKDYREDFRDLSVELADFLQHHDDLDDALHVIDRLISFGFNELKIPVLKSKILFKLDRHTEASKVLMDASTAYRKEGKQKELTLCLEQVLKLDPGNSKARNELRDLRSRFNRRVRRLLVASVVLLVGGFGAWKYYGNLQVADHAKALIAEAKQKSHSPNNAELAKALGILSEVRRIAADTRLGDEAQKLADQILEEQARRKQALIENKNQEYNSLAKAARTSFLKGEFTKALHLYMALATSKVHGSRAKSIREFFLSQQETLATELEGELNRLSTKPLPDVSKLRNMEEYKTAQIELERTFPKERRQNLQAFIEAIRTGIMERHPFLAMAGTEPIQTLDKNLFGHGTIPEGYEVIQKLMAGDTGIPEDLADRIRKMDMEDLDSLAQRTTTAGFISGMNLAQEAGILASPAKALYLDLLDYMIRLQGILQDDRPGMTPEKIQERLVEALRTPPFRITARIESVEKEIGELVARNKEIRTRRQSRTKALATALAISNDTKLSAEQRTKKLHHLDLAWDPRSVLDARRKRAERYLTHMTRELDPKGNSYATRLRALDKIQSQRDWKQLESDEQDVSDSTLMKLLCDEQSVRALRQDRIKFAMLVDRIQQDEPTLESEVEERHTTLQNFQILWEKLGEQATDLEAKQKACHDFQLDIEVRLLRDGGKIQQIEEARRIGTAGLLGRYMALLDQVERREQQLDEKLDTNSNKRVINQYWLKGKQAFKEQKFRLALDNYVKLREGYQKLPAKAQAANLLALFTDWELKLRDICERLDDIAAARERKDHQAALDDYRYLSRTYPDVNFREVVLLPIEITSVPTGARILVNGKAIGETPTTHDAPADTELSIEIRLEGYKPEIFDTRTSLSPRILRHLEIRENWVKAWHAAITTQPTIDKANHRILLSDRRGVFRSIDLKTGSEVYSKTFKSLSGEYDGARIYAGGERFLLASAEGILRRFETRTGKQVADPQDLGKGLLLPSGWTGRSLLFATKEGEILILGPGYTENPNPLLKIQGLKFPPITGEDSSFIAATTDGRVRKWNTNGELLWETDNGVDGCGWRAIVWHGDRLLVPTDTRKIHCLDTVSGRRLWTADLGQDLVHCPAMSDTRAYVATTGQRLVILDLESGKVQNDGPLKLPGDPSGPLAIWQPGRSGTATGPRAAQKPLVMIPIQRAGIRFFDPETGQPACHIGGATTSEVRAGLVEDSFLYFSNAGDVRSYPVAPLLEVPAKPGK